jgi:hypothetical protein
MKHLFLLITTLLLAAGTSIADTSLVDRLRQIKEISGLRVLNAAPYEEAYSFYYEQPVDHQAPGKGTFKQLVQLGHRDFQAPVVAILEGYSVESLQESELSNLLHANQLVIEHRFFQHSVPEGGIPWKELTIAQAAADQHEIIRTLREKVYPGTRWLSTGISKGGQTTIYHRYFYPDDVEVSVPYVAPLNLSYIDPRLGRYLAKLGKTPALRQRGTFMGDGGQETTVRILNFQEYCFENLDRLTPLLQEEAGRQKVSFTLVGGIERAMKLIILEFPFAFWQWDGNVNKIPETELDDIEEHFLYLVSISPIDFLCDQGIRRVQPFFYAALTETGMYAYDIRPFRKYFKDEADRSLIDFRFAMPEDAEPLPFNERQMENINRWLQTGAERMLFIYGGLDPWAATAVDLKGNDKCKIFLKADANHACRVRHFEPIVREEILRTINAWLAGRTVEIPAMPGF